MQTRFKDTNPRNAENKIQRGIRRAMEDRIDQLESNINAFIASVEEVTFNVNEEDAPFWMSNWQAQLLSGIIRDDPVPAPADVADEDTAADSR